MLGLGVQYHNRNDDCEHAVAEILQPSLPISPPLNFLRCFSVAIQDRARAASEPAALRTSAPAS